MFYFKICDCLQCNHAFVEPCFKIRMGPKACVCLRMQLGSQILCLVHVEESNLGFSRRQATAIENPTRQTGSILGSIHTDLVRYLQTQTTATKPINAIDVPKKTYPMDLSSGEFLPELHRALPRQGPSTRHGSLNIGLFTSRLVVRE